MKRFGKVLLVFALVAIMLSSIFVAASADTATEYYNSLRERWKNLFDVMKYHGVPESEDGAVPMPWEVEYNIYDPGNGGSAWANLDGMVPANEEGMLDGGSGSAEDWRDYIDFKAYLDETEYPATVILFIQRKFVNNAPTNEYRIKDINYSEGSFIYVTYKMLETNLYRVTFSWHVEETQVLPHPHDPDGSEIVVLNGYDEVYQMMLDFNELFAEETDVPQHEHVWKFKGFEWNSDNGLKATAVYQCSDTVLINGHEHSFLCDEEYRIEAVVTQLSHDIVSEFMAEITAAQSPDGEEHSDTLRILPVFGGFEWDTTDSVRAFAIYVCRAPGCYDHQYRVEAIVTCANPNAFAPKYKATISAENDPDGVERTESKTISPTINPGSLVRDKVIIKPFNPRPFEPKPIMP